MSEIAQSPVDTITRPYQQMESRLGEQGMQMLDSQLSTWHELNERDLYSPLRESLASGDPTLPEGTLLHGMGMYGFSEEALAGVAEKGILSGELIGISEDSETHGCADFFRVPADTTLEDYMISAKEPLVKGNIKTQKGERLLLRGVTFIVDPQAEGMDGLMQRDGYRDPEMQDFVRPPTSRSSEDTAAILGGVPRGAIAGMVIPEAMSQQIDRVTAIRTYFPNTPVYTTSGQLLAA